MSKQIYIDSDGNEIQVSGTVNSADMLPVEAGSTKMTIEAIDEVNSALSNKTEKSTVNTYNLSSSSPITILRTGAYHAFLIVGFVQGIGIVNLLVKIVNNSTSVIDFVTGSAFSNANLTFAYSPTTKAFVIQTPQSGASVLTIIRGGAN